MDSIALGTPLRDREGGRTHGHQDQDREKHAYEGNQDEQEADRVRRLPRYTPQPHERRKRPEQERLRDDQPAHTQSDEVVFVPELSINHVQPVYQRVFTQGRSFHLRLVARFIVCLG